MPEAYRQKLEQLVLQVIRSPEVTLYKLSEAVEASRVSEARHVRGKLVFKMR